MAFKTKGPSFRSFELRGFVFLTRCTENQIGDAKRIIA